MKIFIAAVVAVLVTVLGFCLADRKKARESEKMPRRSGAPDAKDPADGELLDYSVYVMQPREKCMYILLAALVLFTVGYIFYQNIIISLLVALVAFWYPKLRSRELLLKRQDQLSLQFKQALSSLSSSLSAGKSVENAFKEVADDLRLLYTDPRTYIIQEFAAINNKIDNGVQIEEALADFGRRSGLEDISNFVDVFVICKRTGGNLAEVIRRTSGIIGDKLQVQQDIKVLLAQKRFEAKAMMVAPIAMVAMMSWSSPDYMGPLFIPGKGTVIMTVSLIVMGVAFWGLNKIMDIRV
ncbi:MAG: type II secretion system F family protein [Syntrophomonadaceae bacterium]|jgi:tight adherence protein B